MQATVDRLKSLVEHASLGVAHAEGDLEGALNDPLIREAMERMMRMDQAQKRFILATIETLMVAKR